MHNKTMRAFLAGLVLCGCASPWKIQGGPKECTQICERWGMQLTGMVGVGNQDRTGDGATACVCEVARPGQGTSGGVSTGAAGSSASTAAVVAALQETRRKERD